MKNDNQIEKALQKLAYKAGRSLRLLKKQENDAKELAKLSINLNKRWYTNNFTMIVSQELFDKINNM